MARHLDAASEVAEASRHPRAHLFDVLGAVAQVGSLLRHVRHRAPGLAHLEEKCQSSVQQQVIGCANQRPVPRSRNLGPVLLRSSVLKSIFLSNTTYVNRRIGTVILAFCWSRLGSTLKSHFVYWFTHTFGECFPSPPARSSASL